MWASIREREGERERVGRQREGEVGGGWTHDTARWDGRRGGKWDTDDKGKTRNIQEERESRLKEMWSEAGDHIRISVCPVMVDFSFIQQGAGEAGRSSTCFLLTYWHTHRSRHFHTRTHTHTHAFTHTKTYAGFQLEAVFPNLQNYIQKK